MRVLALHRIAEVALGPFEAGLVVVDTPRARVLSGHEGLDEEKGCVGKKKDRHFWVLFLCFVWLERGERVSDRVGEGQERVRGEDT